MDIVQLFFWLTLNRYLTKSLDTALERLLNVLCMFNLRPVSRGKVFISLHCDFCLLWTCFFPSCTISQNLAILTNSHALCISIVNDSLTRKFTDIHWSGTSVRKSIQTATLLYRKRSWNVSRSGKFVLKNLYIISYERKYSRMLYVKTDHITSNFLQTVFHKFYLVHSRILCLIFYSKLMPI